VTFDEGRATRAVTFFERVLVHCDGEWAGKPFSLMGWQRDLVRTLFGTLRDDGTRQYRTCYVEIPRKCGKSETAAGIALYLLVADNEMGAQIYGAAGDRDQASIVFRVAAEMVHHSPAGWQVPGDRQHQAHRGARHSQLLSGDSIRCGGQPWLQRLWGGG